MHRPDWLPEIRPAPSRGGGVVVGGALDGPVPVGPGVAALRAVRTEVYAAFLLPPPSNSRGLSLDRHESLSRTPQTVMPMHRGTLTQAWVRPAYWLVAELVTSTSVSATSTPRAAKLERV